MEEGERETIEGVTSVQLCVIKESLENMKSTFLQLFMDWDLVLNYAEEKAMEVE